MACAKTEVIYSCAGLYRHDEFSDSAYFLSVCFSLTEIEIFLFVSDVSASPHIADADFGLVIAILASWIPVLSGGVSAWFLEIPDPQNRWDSHSNFVTTMPEG